MLNFFSFPFLFNFFGLFLLHIISWIFFFCLFDLAENRGGRGWNMQMKCKLFFKSLSNLWGYFGGFFFFFLFYYYYYFWLLMSFEMEGQVIGAREASLAMYTFERFGAGVFAIVARQFVAASKSPLAALPWTLVRLFT